MRKRSFSIGTLSDIGYVKRTNQDRVLIKIGEEQFGEFGLFLIADGMGGLTDGHRASELVMREFIDWWNNNLFSIINGSGELDIDRIDRELNELIFHINKEIIRYGKSIDSKVGTTLSMLFIYRNEYIIKHIGDSRIYRIKNEVIRLTEDHSWVSEQIRQGRMNEEEAVNHPKSHVLLQCIGVRENLNIFEKKGRVLDEDIFLLCSDGFYNLLMKDEILDVVREYRVKDEDIQSKVEELMEKVKIRGAFDNASVILICQNYGKEKTGIFEKLKALVSYWG